MLSAIPNFKKLLSIGLILMFIGGFMLTLSSSGSGIKIMGSSRSTIKGPEPPIYPHPGKDQNNIVIFKINDNLRIETTNL